MSVQWRVKQPLIQINVRQDSTLADALRFIYVQDSIEIFWSNQGLVKLLK